MKAIVYTSDTGHTERYAKMLGDKTELSVYKLDEALKQLPYGSEIIYLGWLFANNIKGIKKASKNYKISAAVAVGLCDTGTALDEVRLVNAIPEEIPLFTIQGGMDKTALRRSYRYVINVLIKLFSAKKEKTESDCRMLYLLTHDKDYVSEENLVVFMEWYRKNAF